MLHAGGFRRFCPRAFGSEVQLPQLGGGWALAIGWAGSWLTDIGLCELGQSPHLGPLSKWGSRCKSSTRGPRWIWATNRKPGRINVMGRSLTCTRRAAGLHTSHQHQATQSRTEPVGGSREGAWQVLPKWFSNQVFHGTLMEGRGNKIPATKSPSTRGIPIYLCNIFGFYIRFHPESRKFENNALTV